MLPEYIIEKKLSIVSYIYQKIKKKKYIKKGILLKEDENTYYVIEEMDEIDDLVAELVEEVFAEELVG